MAAYKKPQFMSRALRPGGAGQVEPKEPSLDLGTLGKSPRRGGGGGKLSMPSMPKMPTMPKAPTVPKTPGAVKMPKFK